MRGAPAAKDRPSADRATTAAPAAAAGFDALVLAGPEAHEPSVCGLTLSERARRVAVRAGAERVAIVRAPADAAPLTAGDRPLLVLDAREQVVHTPLVSGLRDAHALRGRSRIAVDPARPTEPAGAALLSGDERRAYVAALRDGAPSLDALAAGWLAGGAADAVPHGELARHPARTRAERRAATRFLFRLVRKPQDTPLIRLVNRRVSYPFTRLLLPTPITPNMISVVVFFIGAFGCWLVSQAGYRPALAGTAVVLFAGYLDGCDGELARLRLESSKLGAWIDTIADEVTTILFIVAAGLHLYHDHPQPAFAAAVVVSTACALLSVYVIYYYLIVVARSGNSQDYPSAPGGRLDLLRMVIKRDFINLAAVGLAAAGLMTLMTVLLDLGAIVTAAILFPQHVALRLSRRRERAQAVATSATALLDPAGPSDLG
ncbi:MAG TPA: CDP-alcohol phosphatidyltransferase family protein [Kofleriaceae bacterium]|nr:CDP-alcohol phosphatidyltransferase family protein [Kofleriaceae bacterium]